MNSLTQRQKLVVAAASRHGSTHEMADRIARTLQHDLASGWQVVRPEVTDLRAFDDADAVVLGSAIYFGRWMRPAVHALKYLRSTAEPSLWLFSSGPVSDLETENARIIAVDSTVDTGQAIQHEVFGGQLDISRLSWMERTIVKAIHVPPGDHRDWQHIDDWAHQIAEQLSVPPIRQNGTNGNSEGTRGL